MKSRTSLAFPLVARTLRCALRGLEPYGGRVTTPSAETTRLSSLRQVNVTSPAPLAGSVMLPRTAFWSQITMSCKALRTFCRSVMSATTVTVNVRVAVNPA